MSAQTDKDSFGKKVLLIQSPGQVKGRQMCKAGTDW